MKSEIRSSCPLSQDAGQAEGASPFVCYDALSGVDYTDPSKGFQRLGNIPVRAVRHQRDGAAAGVLERNLTVIGLVDKTLGIVFVIGDKDEFGSTTSRNSVTNAVSP